MNADVLKRLKAKARDRWVAGQPAHKELVAAVERATEARQEAWDNTDETPMGYVLAIQKATRLLSKERRHLDKLTRELETYFDQQVRGIRPDG